jgi:hypothetical protein
MKDPRLEVEELQVDQNGERDRGHHEDSATVSKSKSLDVWTDLVMGGQSLMTSMLGEN